MKRIKAQDIHAARNFGTLGLLLALVLLGGCSAPSPVANCARFREGDAADFVARYFSDETSYVMRPEMKDGTFPSICDRTRLLKVAREQPRHELAVIVLVHYQTAEAEEPVKLAWVNELTSQGYRRVVFLRGNGRMEVDGLPILETPRVPPTFAGK